MKHLFLFSFMLALLCKVQAENFSVSDSLLKTGRLSNGLTYYIRHNPASSGHASFYLVQNVGALLEQDHQNGLAHFLEHMAFNGSQHFPGKSMIRMLEKHGVAFGQGVNAYTSLNETIYGLDHVPTRQNMLDSCLLILHDWSHFLNLDEQAMESERPVILEEWRTRRDADFRLQAQITPVTLQGSQYAVRDIIGDTAVIRNFHPDELRGFYRTWYRPDLQAIVVVGDLDIARTEQKIKTLFADIPASRQALSRPFFEIPLEKPFVFVQATDPEAPRIRIQVRTLQKASSEVMSVSERWKEELKTELFNRLMRERLYDMFQRQGLPALAYSLVRHDAQRGYRSLTLTLIPRAGDEEKVLKAALAEKERVRRFGFTQEELKRARATLLKEAEMAVSGQNRQPDGFYVEQLSRHFLEDKPILSATARLEAMHRELPLITSGQLLAKLAAWDDGSNYIVSVTGPDNMTRMDSAGIRQLLSATGKLSLSPYEDRSPVTLAIPDVPSGGKIIKETLREQSAAKEWILSNGAQVIFKPLSTEQRISVLAFRKGGIAGCLTKDLAAAFLLPSLVGNYGLGDLDGLQFNKLVSAKDLNCGVSIQPSYEAVSGEGPASEIETLMQIMWMRFTHPRFDPVTHRGVINSQKARWATRGQNPLLRMNDTLVATLGNYDPRIMPLRPEQFDSISLQQTQKLYREKFSDITGFTFIIAGNGDEKQVKQLAEKYIGSLPFSGTLPCKTMYTVPLRGWKVQTKIIPMELAEQRSTVLVNLIGDLAYSLENDYHLDVLRALLELHCMRELREKDGSVYSVAVQKDFEILPVGKAMLMVSFDCAPGREKELSGRIDEIFRSLSIEGPRPDDLQNVVRNLGAERQKMPRNNQYWIHGLFYKSLYGVDKTDDVYYSRFCSRITPAACRSFLQKFRKKVHRTEFFFQPR